MKSIHYYLAALILIFSSCNLFETPNPYGGKITYEVSFEGLQYWTEEETLDFSKYFRTDIIYKDENGEMITLEDEQYNITKSEYVAQPFNAVLEIRHSLRPGAVAGLSPYDKIPVYTGNLCGLRVEEAGLADDLSRYGYEWVGLSPLYELSEIYLLRVEKWLAEYGTQRYTMRFTKTDWEKNRKYK